MHTKRNMPPSETLVRTSDTSVGIGTPCPPQDRGQLGTPGMASVREMGHIHPGQLVSVSLMQPQAFTQKKGAGGAIHISYNQGVTTHQSGDVKEQQLHLKLRQLIYYCRTERQSVRRLLVFFPPPCIGCYKTDTLIIFPPTVIKIESYQQNQDKNCRSHDNLCL